MAGEFYSVGVRLREGGLPFPAQSGITDKRVADALKRLYPRRMQPTVEQDTYSISAFARQLAGAGLQNSQEPGQPSAADLNKMDTYARNAPVGSGGNGKDSQAAGAPETVAPGAAGVNPLKGSQPAVGGVGYTPGASINLVA